jgi:hypothetical protein
MLLKNLPALGFLVLSASLRICGQTSVSGDLSKYLFDPVSGPYIIEKDIEVPSDKKVVINAGCVLLFKQFTGLNVFGSLIVNGTESHPVIFTTINDSLYSKQAGQTANPFDWNGINIDKKAAEVSLSDFKLMYSVYGIKSQRRDIAIKNGKFKSNGQFHFTIFDKIQYVQDNMSFSYPDDSSMVNIAPRQAFKTKVSVSSFPSKAEIYINRKPGKKISPIARTPATINDVEGPAVQMTLFQKGFSDTTFILNLEQFQAKYVNISLPPLRAEGIDAQNQLLHDRFQVNLGRWCFYVSPLFLAAGAGCLYYADKNFKKADAIQITYNQSFRPENDPQKKALVKQRDDELDQGKMKRYAAIGSFGVGALVFATGLFLYF